MVPRSSIKQDPLLDYYNRFSNEERPADITEKNFLPPSEGSGFVTCCRLESGFCAGYYNLMFYEDSTFSYTPAVTNSGISLFRMNFSLMEQGASENFYAPHFLTNNRVNFNAINFGRLGFLPKNKNYKSIEFIFSSEWLIRNYQVSSNQLFTFIRFLSAKKDPSILLDLLDHRTVEQANIIATDLDRVNIALLHLKAKIFSFIDAFFQKALERAEGNLQKGKGLQYAIIKDVEKYLGNYYGDELPSIAELANQFNISTSTLKRQFKLIYHKNIYSYYLEQKMTLGLSMLEDNKASVSEIAYSLGYQKVNSFSKIFKKRFGILPSQVQIA